MLRRTCLFTKQMLRACVLQPPPPTATDTKGGHCNRKFAKVCTVLLAAQHTVKCEIKGSVPI